MMRLNWLLVWLIPILSYGQVNVLATLDSTSIIIGDQVQLTIQVSYPAGVSIVKVDLSEINQVNYIEILKEKDFELLKSDEDNLFEKKINANFI